jgi:4-amino-4-deoxy-L-arabinose transferase-like glycosyltransferase
MKELYRNKTLIWTLLIAFTVALLFALGARTLVPPDEGRYAEMAREMFATGDWITTRLNGIKYFEKPPLQTWMNALTFQLFGLGDWQARLWTGLCGLFGVLLTGYTGRRVFGERVGFYAALVLGSCFYWVACSQIDSLDMGVSGMMTLALCALLIAQRDDAKPAEQRNWMLACWAGMALAMLAKGLIGIVLPGAVLVVYTVLARDWKIWTRLHLVKGLILFALIAAPWFVLVGLKNPEQPHFFFIHEHFQRFATKEAHREAAWCWCRAWCWAHNVKTMRRVRASSVRACSRWCGWPSSCCSSPSPIPSCPATSCRCSRAWPCWSRTTWKRARGAAACSPPASPPCWASPCWPPCLTC